MKPSPPALVFDCDRQDAVFRPAFQLLERGIPERAFPGATLAVTHQGRLVALKGIGRFTYEPDSPVVTAETIYDLASVTKAVATTAVAMVLFDRGLLQLEMPLAELLPEFAQPSISDAAGADRNRVTLRMLLAHSSGLPAYARLFEQVRGREAMLRTACSLPLEALPGTRAEYSDIGFLLLGEAVARLAGASLSNLAEREVFSPLGMHATMFRPPETLRPEIPPTERTNDGEVVQGIVHDENARAFGVDQQTGQLVTDAAHAGVFAPALDLARFAHAMLNGGAPIVSRETVRLFTQRETLPPNTSRALGWDTPSPPSQSGRYFSPHSYGHLGFTGTSIWIDPERLLSVTLLTNRTWPDRSSQLIKTIRPAFHDAVVQALSAR